MDSGKTDHRSSGSGSSMQERRAARDESVAIEKLVSEGDPGGPGESEDGKWKGRGQAHCTVPSFMLM